MYKAKKIAARIMFVDKEKLFILTERFLFFSPLLQNWANWHIFFSHFSQNLFSLIFVHGV